MTKEQTIEKLKALYTNAVAAMLRADACDDDESSKVMTEYAETLDSAITALQTDGDCISRQAALDILDEFADNVLEVKHGTYERARKAMCDVPSIQPEPCEDAVSRKAVANMLDNIEIPRNASWYLYYHQALDRLTKLPSVQPEPSTEIQEILDYLDTTLHPIVSPDNWYVYAELHDMISSLPSAQPDVIRCKDCKHYKPRITCVEGHYNGCDAWLDNGNEIEVAPDDYCSYAERRTDEQTDNR